MTDKTAGLWAALIAARKEFQAVIKDKTGQVGSRNYQYADLANVLDACTDALLAHDLYVYQAPTMVFEVGVLGMALVSRIVHAPTGEIVEDSLPLPKADTMQALGSAITYARRYLLMCQLGLAGEDDDGASIAQSQTKRMQSQPQRTQYSKSAAAKPKAPAKAAAKPKASQGLIDELEFKGKNPIEDERLPDEDNPFDDVDEEGRDLIASWGTNGSAAKEWAIEVGACDNIYEANKSLAKIAQESFGGKYTGNEREILTKFYLRQVEKMEELSE